MPRPSPLRIALLPALHLALAACGLACGGDDGGSGGSGGSTTSDTGGGGATPAGVGGGSTTGVGGQGAGGATSTLDCAGLPLCDDFETAAPGGPPDPAVWSVVSPNCSGTGTLAIDDAHAHSGARSVRIDGGGNYCDHVFIANSTAIAAVGAAVHGRFFVRFEDPLGMSHVTFLTLRDENAGGRDLRMGGQSEILMWNRETDDATLPSLSPAGIAQSLRPTAGAWHCIEFFVDGPSGVLQTWVDGAAVPGLQVDATPTPDIDQQWHNQPGWAPALSDVKFGWEGYGGQPMTLWVDDIALAAQRIGCD
ncbi:hypothetical protein [Chondromyces crocatus]|uniref:Hydrolase n=1 Tax=Chondromyces crocatus TaxID=52 RepID=A0A0K1EJG6_CHOCO|nr:hypothetical protein [Chondromyces crocatus]AKT41004.1 hydrolase [Chondromyces crocatus]